MTDRGGIDTYGREVGLVLRIAAGEADGNNTSILQVEPIRAVRDESRCQEINRTPQVVPLRQRRGPTVEMSVDER